MRPNYAQDAPPTEISVGGFAYPANTDYRVWIDVLRLLRELNIASDDPEQMERNLEIIHEMETLVFGDVLADEGEWDALKAILDFSRGYPSAPIEPERGGAQTYSFEYDLNEIIIAIRNQSGIDLSYRRKEPFHWWEFLLEFRTLCGEHYILNLMEARGYRGNDKDMIRRRQRCALPVEYTAAEQAEIDAFEALFEEGNHED